MNNILKKTISAALGFCIMFGSIAAVDAFTPRNELSKEDCSLKYWAYSPDGNMFTRNWNRAGGNCTWYAYGRAWELIGERPKLSVNGAHKWYTYNDGYERGTEPRLGAVACWSNNSGTVGHVAIVEEIEDDGVIVSESGWSFSDSYFRYKKMNFDNMNFSVGGDPRIFQGYIYLPINYAPEDENGYAHKKKSSPFIQREIHIYLDGDHMDWSGEAVIYDDTVLVPARDLIEAFGGDIVWEQETKTVITFIHGLRFTAQLDSNVMTIDSIPVYSSVPVMLNRENRTMLPLRAVISMFGARITSVDEKMNINIVS